MGQWSAKVRLTFLFSKNAKRFYKDFSRRQDALSNLLFDSKPTFRNGFYFERLPP
jgi:hypothetical protein